MPVFSYEQLRKMNPGEFRVYNFMVSHLEMVPEMNIRQIAGGAGVSATTVLRFCEKAGCSGYTELKYRVRQELDRSDRKGSFDADPAIQYMKNAARDEGFAEKMAQAAKICEAAGQIILSGNRESRPLIRYGAYLFSGIGKPAFTAEEGWGSICPVGEAKPALLILSSQGGGEELISLINGYKKAGSSLVSVTNTEHCPIAQMSDVNFACYMPEISRVSRTGRTELVSQLPLVYLLETLVSEMQGYKK